jgi:uncharacterized membrane protein (DUF106 family)
MVNERLVQKIVGYSIIGMFGGMLYFVICTIFAIPTALIITLILGRWEFFWRILIGSYVVWGVMLQLNYTSTKKEKMKELKKDQSELRRALEKERA